jgi:hypothetical protein
LASRHPVFITLRVGKHVEPLRSRQMVPGVLKALMAASGRRFRVVEFSVPEDQSAVLGLASHASGPSADRAGTHLATEGGVEDSGRLDHGECPAERPP